jgi:hypothetical protein
MRSLRSALLIAAALFSGALSATPAAAMPFAKPVVRSDDAVQTVAFACGPFRCSWRPNYYYAAPLYAAPVYVAPPAYVPAYVIPYTAGPGWYGGWRRGFYGGWWGRRWY